MISFGISFMINKMNIGSKNNIFLGFNGKEELKIEKQQKRKDKPREHFTKKDSNNVKNNKS